MHVELQSVGARSQIDRLRQRPLRCHSLEGVFSFNLGTGLAIYTWWFLHNAGGRRTFGKEQA
jgi:hypothetical protein